MTRVGGPEVLEVREAPDPTPRERQVRIRVRAAGINFADIMARVGLYPDAPPLPTVVGYEVAGVIDEVGAAVTQRAVGDEVVAMTRFGGYTDTLCVPEEQAFPKPKRCTFEQAAAIPVVYATAYQLIVTMGALKRGERVLIHGAAGGVGLAAIDLAHIVGAEVYGLASASKHAFLHDRGVRHCVDYRTQDFETEITRLTSGRGVHLVLDPNGGSSWAKSYRLLAPTGRLAIYGLQGAATHKGRDVLGVLKTLATVPWLDFNPFKLMSENKAIVGVNLGHLWSEAEMVRGWLREILAWTEEGKVRPYVGKTFPLAEAAAAHHYIQDRQNIGKVVLVP